MDPTLSDFDELILHVRDRASRVYIAEAVAAYRGRAYRASVIATWLAVQLDIVSKLRELAAQGDKQAHQAVEEIDRATQAKNLRQMQDLEGGLLERARSDYAFFTEREFVDLDRIRLDRHQCAHPAFTETATFDPTPELARLHIVHAIRHVLSQPPVQGKAALERIRVDLLQPSFPRTQKEAKAYFTGRYLDRARESLVASIVAVFLKVLLRGVDADFVGKETQVLHCLAAVAERHSVTYETVTRSQVVQLIAQANDAQLTAALPLLGQDPRCWDWLDEPGRIRLRSLIETELRGDNPRLAEESTRADVARVLHALSVPALAELVRARYLALDPVWRDILLAAFPTWALVDDAIALFGLSGSFASAGRRWNTFILPYASGMQAEHVRTVLRHVRENGQIWYASGSLTALPKFFDLTRAHLGTVVGDWQDTLTYLIEHGGEGDPAETYAYPAVRERLTAAGLWPPPPPPPPPPKPASGAPAT